MTKSVPEDVQIKLTKLKDSLEYCFESMCKHEGNLRELLGRKWCFDCNSYIYDYDMAKIKEARKVLEEK